MDEIKVGSDTGPTTLDVGMWRRRFIQFLNANWHTDDGAHDIHHLHRVWRTCQRLNSEEGGVADELVLLTSCYFHDFVSVPKNDPARSRTSLLSADKVSVLLTDEFREFPTVLIPQVHHAIHAHSFSAQVPVNTIEAAILQDADRMEALGAIGLARMFYTAGKMDSRLFDPEDVLAENRPLDDRQFSLDHIAVKLLTLPGTMNTGAGRTMAEQEARFLVDFRAKLVAEVQGT